MKRADRVAQILALRAQGFTNRQVAMRLGISNSTVRNALYDPDGSKQRALRDSYSGTCIDCGATTRSDGTSHASERCSECSRPEKYWTKDVVIDAIQRFAARNGRPPTADEWITRDPIHNYPARTSVYRANTRSSSPFIRWQDALAAAGFPGAHSGRRTYKEVHSVTQERYGYVILHERDDGTWEVVGTEAEGTQIGALNAALNGHEPVGRWVAVPGKSWRPRELRPRTIFDWAEDPEATPAA